MKPVQPGKVLIDTYKYFKYVFGFSEKTIDDVLTKCRAEELENGETVIHCPKGVVRAGRFRVVSVKDLLAEAALVPPAKRRGTLNSLGFPLCVLRLLTCFFLQKL
jgi:hypothetical protein